MLLRPKSQFHMRVLQSELSPKSVFVASVVLTCPSFFVGTDLVDRIHIALVRPRYIALLQTALASEVMRSILSDCPSLSLYLLNQLTFDLNF